MLEYFESEYVHRKLVLQNRKLYQNSAFCTETCRNDSCTPIVEISDVFRTLKIPEVLKRTGNCAVFSVMVKNKVFKLSGMIDCIYLIWKTHIKFIAVNSGSSIIIQFFFSIQMLLGLVMDCFKSKYTYWKLILLNRAFFI